MLLHDAGKGTGVRIADSSSGASLSPAAGGGTDRRDRRARRDGAMVSRSGRLCEGPKYGIRDRVIAAEHERAVASGEHVANPLLDGGSRLGRRRRTQRHRLHPRARPAPRGCRRVRSRCYSIRTTTPGGSRPARQLRRAERTTTVPGRSHEGYNGHGGLQCTAGASRECGRRGLVRRTNEGPPCGGPGS